MSQPARSAARAFTIIEVMVAVGIVVIALGAIVGQMGQNTFARQAIADRRAANDIAQSIIQRIQTCQWENLGTDKQPWSYGRYSNGDGHPPLREGASSPQDDIAQLGLISVERVPHNLRIYIEWYRAVDSTDDTNIAIPGEPGIFTANAATTAAFRASVYQTPTDPRSPLKTIYRPGTGGVNYNPAGNVSPTTYLTTSAPLAARVLVLWGGSPLDLPNQIELFTVRSN